MTTQQGKIPALEFNLRSIRETRVIYGPARSLELVGPGRAVILTLAGFLALILGIFAVFFTEFVAKSRTVVTDKMIMGRA